MENSPSTPLFQSPKSIDSRGYSPIVQLLNSPEPPKNSASHFMHYVYEVLSNLSNHSKAYFKFEEFTPALASFANSWLESAGTGSFCLTFNTSNDQYCTDCSELRAEIDRIESIHMAEIENFYKNLQEKNLEILNLKKENQKLQNRVKVGSYERIYSKYISKIRTEIQNLLDIALPQVGEEVELDLHNFLKALRRNLSQLPNKFIRKLGYKPQGKNIANCNLLDIQTTIDRLNEVHKQVTETFEQNFRVNIGNFELTLVVTRDSAKESLVKRRRRRLLTKKNFTEQDQLQDFLDSFSKNMKAAYYNELSQMENMLCGLHEEIEESKYLQGNHKGVSFEVNKELYREIRAKEEEISVLTHKLNKAQLKTESLVKRLKEEEEKSYKVSEENQRIKQNLNLFKKEVDEVFETQDTKTDTRFRKLTPRLLTKKVIEDSNAITRKVQRSLACIEKEWIYREEKSLIKSQRDRTPTPTPLVSLNSSLTRGFKLSRSVSPISDVPNLSFKSISWISQDRSQRTQRQEEVDYLRKELDSCLEEKSKLEHRLKELEEQGASTKLDNIKAKEKEASKLLEMRLEEYNKVLELKNHHQKQSEEIKNQQKRLLEQKHQLETKSEYLQQDLENFKKVESSISKMLSGNAKGCLELLRNQRKELCKERDQLASVKFEYQLKIQKLKESFQEFLDVTVNNGVNK